VSGSVLRVIRESEQVVQAGEPIMQIGDPRDIDVVVELLSTDAVAIRPGVPARIEGWGGPPLAARVRRVEPSGFTKVSALGVEEQRVLVYLDFVEPGQAARLGHDYRVTARIITSSTPRALRVPASALFRQGADWAVYRLVDGRAELLKVQVGRRNEDFAEVLGGLAEADRVVVYPGDRLADGVRVTLRKVE
jgi:HlyD family secretion protein